MMKGISYLNSCLDPIAKAWGGVKPEFPCRLVKDKDKKTSIKKVKK